MIRYPYSKHSFDNQEIEAVVSVLKNGWIARGPKLREFENNFSERLNYSYSTVCSNGSAAIEIALRSFGICHGDEVIVPTLSWASTATSVSMVGAKPIFADISLDNYCIDPSSIKLKITPKTKAIIPVHFAGVPAEMEEIWNIAEQYGITVIEDCAHALGGYYHDGMPIGGSERSYASTFSLHPAKNITSAEGGIIVSSSSQTKASLDLYRSGGVERRSSEGLTKAFYEIPVISSNYHLTDIQCAIGIVQLNKLKNFVAIRQQQVLRYQKHFSKVKEDLVHIHPSSSSANLYISLLPCEVDRNFIFEELNSHGIGAYYHYPLLHKSKVYANNSIQLPNAEEYSRRALTLPLGPHLSLDDIDFISNMLCALICP